MDHNIEDQIQQNQKLMEAMDFRVSDIYDVPTPELLAKCDAMADELRRKHPGMKPNRIARKVAEYYKLKKEVPVDGS